AGPVERPAPARDELAIKLALAVGSPTVDVRRVLQAQRSATRQGLKELTRLRAGACDDADLAWTLVLDALVFQAEAELRWLDHCETRLGTRPVGKPADEQEAASR
ncbi:MAG TPA: hypothetical protein VNC85_11020, partial [Mycobacteriales bacterium]|nr:hypothetical protein [Mycobacteriales bacterium]